HHEDRWNVEATGGHQMGRWRLVARREADHAVELRAFDRDLHVVDDEIAAGQHVAAARTSTDDEIAWSCGAYFEGETAGLANRIFHNLRDAVEMAEADCQLRRAVDDRDLRFQHVFGGETEGSPLRPTHRFARGARFEVAAQGSLHGSLTV